MPNSSSPSISRVPRRLVAAVEDEGEEAGRAREVARPEFVARTIAQRRMEHPRHLRLLLQPARDLEAALLVPLQPDGERAQAAQRQPGVVGAGGLAEDAAGLLEPSARSPRSPSPSRASDRHGRRYIWCRRGSRGRSPAAIAGKKSGVAQVLSIRVTRPRAFAAAQIAGTSWTSKVWVPGLSMKMARVCSPISVGDAGADHRIVIAGRDAEALEHVVAEGPGRPVGAVDHQQLVAGREHREQGAGDRGRAGRIEPGHRRARLELGQRLAQRPGRRRAVAAVMEDAVARRIGRLHVGDAVEQDGRGAPDRRVDDAAASIPRGGRPRPAASRASFPSCRRPSPWACPDRRPIRTSCRRRAGRRPCRADGRRTGGPPAVTPEPQVVTIGFVEVDAGRVEHGAQRVAALPAVVGVEEAALCGRLRAPGMWPEARPGRGSASLAGEARGRRGRRRSRGCRRRSGRGRRPCRPPPARSSEAVK